MVILAIGLHSALAYLAGVPRASAVQRTTNHHRSHGSSGRVPGKSIGKRHQAVFEIGWCHFNRIELSDSPTLVITEKCERRSESGSEGRTDFCRIRTDDRQLTVVDLQVLLQLREAPHLARAFRSPIAAVEAHDQRKATGQFGQRDQVDADDPGSVKSGNRLPTTRSGCICVSFHSHGMAHGAKRFSESGRNNASRK